MDQTNQLPIACSLSPETVQTRRAKLLPGLVQRADAVDWLANGMRLRFDASADALQDIASTIEAERQCCRFLRFELAIEPDAGPIWLTLTGPPGTTEFLDALVRD
jgi:hypothetical protein